MIFGEASDTSCKISVEIYLSDFPKKSCNPQISATFAPQIIEAIICHDTR
jgi:hypothetical protein